MGLAAVYLQSSRKAWHIPTGALPLVCLGGTDNSGCPYRETRTEEEIPITSIGAGESESPEAHQRFVTYYHETISIRSNARLHVVQPAKLATCQVSFLRVRADLEKRILAVEGGPPATLHVRQLPSSPVCKKNSFAGWGLNFAISVRGQGDRHPILGIYWVVPVVLGGRALTALKRQTGGWREAIAPRRCRQLRAMVSPPPPRRWPYLVAVIAKSSSEGGTV